MSKNGTKTTLSKHKIIIGPVMLFLISVLLTIFMKVTENDNKFSDAFIPVKDGWKVVINDHEYTNVSLDEFSFPSTDSGDHLEFSTSLPYRYSSASLALYSVHSSFQVMLDNEVIYSYGIKDKEEGKLTGYGFHKVTLPHEYEGKTIKIIMDVLEDNSFTTIDCPRLCNQEIYDYAFIYNKRMSLALNVYLIVFGVIASVITSTLTLVNRKLFSLIYISMFAVTIGIWSLANYNMFYIFNSSLKVKTVFEYSSLYLAPLFLMLYYKEKACSESSLRKKIYYILLTGYLIFAVCAFGGQITNMIHFPDFLSVSHMMMITVMLYIIICTALDSRKKTHHETVLLWGLIIFFIFALTDVFKYYYTKYIHPSWIYDYQNHITIGFLVFVMAIYSDYVQNVIRSLYKAAESEMLEKLAYTDALTGLFNRRKCENIFDEIDSSGSEYTLIVFDLNHLKQVNDTKGHEEGDRYISSFGSVLKDVFEKFGDVARTGGDEFIVISRRADKDETEKLIEEMNHKIKIRNIQNSGWNMSTAYGYSSSDENIFADIRKAYKEADSRMYDNKIKTKEALKITQAEN